MLNDGYRVKWGEPTGDFTQLLVTSCTISNAHGQIQQSERNHNDANLDPTTRSFI